jgi:hypothetical protein
VASIMVYDLPPGADPVNVQHRAAGGATAPSSQAEGPPEPLSRSHVIFTYESGDGERIDIGSWNPPPSDEPADAIAAIHFMATDERETADLWRAELAAGRLPQTTDDPD